MQTAEERQAQNAHHNKMLDQLHASVMATRSHALNIKHELNEQDTMLSEVQQGVDTANFESRRQTQQILVLIQDTKHRGFYVVVLILMLIIIVLVMI